MHEKLYKRDNTIRTSISNQMKKTEDQRLAKEYIQILFVDKEGDGKAAKECYLTITRQCGGLKSSIYVFTRVLDPSP